MLALGALNAAAQDRRDDDRADPREERGIRAGSFVISPTIAATGGYDSNVFLTENSPTATAVFKLAPRVTVESDWNRHAVRVDAGAEVGVFSHDGDDNYLDADLSFAGEIDITRSARIFASLGYERGHDARGSDDVPGASTEPVIFTNLASEIGGEITFNAFRIAPFASAIWRDFDDTGLVGGGVDNQDDRDRLEYEAGVEVGYRINRGYQAFIRSSVLIADYEVSFDDTGLNRDSISYEVQAGAKLRLTRLFEGSVAAGYVHRSYDDQRLSDTSEVTADVALVWSPTQRINVFANVERNIFETAVGGASDVVTTRTELGVTYELTRTLGLNAGAGYSNLRFSGAARTDNIFSASVGADWSATRGVTISPEYQFGLRESDAAGQDYMDHRFSVTATYQF